MDFVETTIAKRLFDALIASGRNISVDYNEGPEIELVASKNWPDVLKASGAVCDCWWLMDYDKKTGKFDRFVRLIWGNGADCISDYSTSLSHIIEPITEWIEKEKM
jgi:hypothetical protein